MLSSEGQNGKMGKRGCGAGPFPFPASGCEPDLHPEAEIPSCVGSVALPRDLVLDWIDGCLRERNEQIGAACDEMQNFPSVALRRAPVGEDVRYIVLAGADGRRSLQFRAEGREVQRLMLPVHLDHILGNFLLSLATKFSSAPDPFLAAMTRLKSSLYIGDCCSGTNM